MVQRRQKSCQDNLLTRSQQLAADFVDKGRRPNTKTTFDMLQHSTFKSFCLYGIWQPICFSYMPSSYVCLYVCNNFIVLQQGLFKHSCGVKQPTTAAPCRMHGGANPAMAQRKSKWGRADITVITLHPAFYPRPGFLSQSTEQSLDWFRSYLTQRLQVFTTNSRLTDPITLTSGVPQGSSIGPAQFISYTGCTTDTFTQ